MIWQNSSCRSLSRFRLALFQRARCTPLSLANAFFFRCCKCPKTWTFEQKLRWLSFQLAVTTWLKSWCLSHIASKRKGLRWGGQGSRLKSKGRSVRSLHRCLRTRSISCFIGRLFSLFWTYHFKILTPQSKFKRGLNFQPGVIKLLWLTVGKC